jgi:hypothetical protein
MGHPIGRLMHDFHCQDGREIVNPLLAQEVIYMKESEGGRDHMCKILEDMREEAAKVATQKTKHEIVSKMLKQGVSYDTISACTEMSIDDIRKLADKMPA